MLSHHLDEITNDNEHQNVRYGIQKTKNIKTKTKNEKKNMGKLSRFWDFHTFSYTFFVLISFVQPIHYHVMLSHHKPSAN